MISELVDTASKTRDNAFALKSEHKIGAAVETIDGEVFGGCNIESNVSGLGTCAERLAINHAVTHGKYLFKALLTYDKIPIIPCGACLQYMMEFQALSDTDIIIYSATPDGVIENKLKELLPKAYISPKAKEKLQTYVNG